MPTRIVQLDDAAQNRTILRISGSLTQPEAELIERICRDLPGSLSKIVLDLAELDYMDSDAASVLVQLMREHDIETEGVHNLVQAAIDEAERSDATG